MSYSTINFVPFFRHVRRAVPSLRNRMTAATVGVTLSDFNGSFTRMVQTLDFTTIRRAHKEYCSDARTGKHISLADIFVISADVESGEDKSLLQSLSFCLALLDRSIRAGILYGMVTPPSTFAEPSCRGRTYYFRSRLSNI